MNRIQQAETCLLEVLISALDARESAKRGASPMLVYLADMMIQKAREELEDIKLGGWPDDRCRTPEAA